MSKALKDLSEDELKKFREVNISINAYLLEQMCQVLELAHEKGTFALENLQYVGALYNQVAGGIRKTAERIKKGDTAESDTADAEASEPASEVVAE